MGVTEPEATFSACYGGAFLMWHPMKYASMLAEKMREHGTKGWLVNTGEDTRTAPITSPTSNSRDCILMHGHCSCNQYQQGLH